jgi:hypothetical protein
MLCYAEHFYLTGSSSQELSYLIKKEPCYALFCYARFFLRYYILLPISLIFFTSRKPRNTSIYPFAII